MWPTGAFLLVFVVGYLLGAIPTSFIIGKLFFHLDLRQHGSGNLGATNAFRVLGTRAGIAVGALDVLKGIGAVLFARIVVIGAGGFINILSLERMGQAGSSGSALGSAATAIDLTTWLLLAAALAAIIGHAFSPYIGFRGGKSIATSAGVMIALMPTVFALELVVFAAILALTRYVSVASLGAAVLFPVWTLLLHQPLPYTLLAFIVAVFVAWLHRANIGRLRRGEEPKLSFSSSRFSHRK